MHTADDDRTDGVEFIYGRQTIREVLRAGRRRLLALHRAPGLRAADILEEIMRLAREARAPVRETPKRMLDRFSQSGHHQGLVLEAGPYVYEEWPDFLRRVTTSVGEPAFVLALDQLHDPQNVGSLLRTAETLGVGGVLLSSERAVGITPAVARASSGAADFLGIARASSLPDALRELRAAGLRVWGLAAEADAAPAEKTDLRGPTALVVGNEGEGLSKPARRACDGLIRLAMRGRVQSLNAAVAGALALYETRRQRAV